MRMRRKPWARPELAACAFYISDPEALRGRWHERFGSGGPLYIELGCGKGAFLAHEAALHPERNYLAIDIKSEVLALAKRHIDAEFAPLGRAPQNILVLSWDIERIDRILAESDCADTLYINFCNPWPRPKHHKRRLTHPRQLLKYRAFLRDGGTLAFKTDDDELYRDTLRYLPESGFRVVEAQDSCYAQGVPAGTVLTEHEQMFLDRGLPVHRILAVKEALPAGMTEEKLKALRL